MADHDFYQQLLDSMHDGVYFVDRQRRITYWNQGAERISGYSAADVTGHFCWQGLLRHVDAQGTPLCWNGCPLRATMLDGEAREIEVYLHHKDGHRVPVWVRAAPIRDEQGTITGAVEVFSDNTLKHLVAQQLEQLQHMALLDHLTGVGNRRLAENQLQTWLEELRRYNWTVGVILVDIDRFKQVNDTHGHTAGDQVLQMVARSLRHAVRAVDLVARWGGEEFIVVVRNVTAEQVAMLAERLRILVAASAVEIGQQTIHVTISAGAALARIDDTLVDLFARVDRLLYASKLRGRNQVTIAEEPAP